MMPNEPEEVTAATEAYKNRDDEIVLTREVDCPTWGSWGVRATATRSYRLTQHSLLCKTSFRYSNDDTDFDADVVSAIQVVLREAYACYIAWIPQCRDEMVFTLFMARLNAGKIVRKSVFLPASSSAPARYVVVSADRVSSSVVSVTINELDNTNSLVCVNDRLRKDFASGWVRLN
jgi:hypothetical protein